MYRMTFAGRTGRFFLGLSILGLCVASSGTPQASAAETTWTGADLTSPTDFEVGNNWTAGVPANNLTDDTAVFIAKGASPNPALTMNREIYGIDLQNTGWTLGGAAYTLTVGAGGIKTTHTAATATTIQAQVALGASSTWTLGPGSSTLTLSGGLRSDVGSTLTLSSGTWYSPILNVTGPTSLAGDVRLQVSNLKITDYTEDSITGNLRFHGGVLAIDADLTRNLGTGPGQIQFTGGSPNGFTNFGSNRITVTLGDGSGGPAELKWGTGYFNPGSFVLSGYGAGIGGITLPNPIDLNGANRTFFNYRENYTAELTGLISNSAAGTAAGISQHLNSRGTIYLANNANTFNGPITMLGGVVRFDTIGNIGSGPSALGNPANAVDGRITLGHLCCNLLWTGTLLYTGSDTLTTDRPIQLGGHAAIRSNGTGTIAFTADMDPAINDTARTFTLGGTSTGENTFAGRIVEFSAAKPTSFVKADAGTWVLAGDNTYTGTTTVSGGTLIATKPAALPGYDVTGRVSTTASGATLAVRAGAAGEWTSPELTTLLANATFAAGSNFGIEVTAGNAFEHTTAIGGSQGLVKLGGGTLTLSGPNTYTGNTTVRAGTLQLGANNVLSQANLTVAGGATLDMQGFNQSVNALYLQDGTIDGAGTLSLGAQSFLTKGVINANLSGNLGTGDLNRIEIGGDPTATVELNGNNTFTAGSWGILIGHAPTAGGNAGIVKLGHPHALGNTGRTSLYTGALDLNGLANVAANYIMLRSSAASLVNNNTSATASTAAQVMVRGGTSGNPSTDCKIGGPGNLVLSGQLTDGGNNNGFQKIGTGTLILTGNSIYTGATTISEGILQLGNGGTSGSLSPSSAINNQAVLAFNRSDTVTQGTHFANVISGSGEVRKLGSGTVILSEDNTYTGPTVLSGGVLSVSKLANGGLPSSIGASSNAQANLHFATSSTLRYTGGTVATDRRFSLPSGVFATFDVTQSDTELTLVGQTSGVTGYVTKTGPGTLILSGVNTYIGDTTVNAGTLRVGSSGSLSGGSYGLRVRPTTSGVDAILDLNGSNLTATRHSFAINFGGSGAAAGSDMLLSTGAGTITFGDTVTSPSVITYDATNNPNGATLSGNLNLGGLTRTFTVGDSSAAENDLTISAAIAGGAGAGLIKEGAGTLALSGDNTYSGPTAVSAGRLLVHGTHTGGGDYTVNSGATLGGTGSIGASIGIQSGARLAPGASIGRLTIGGELTLADGAEWYWEFLNNDSPDNYDQVAGPTLILPSDGGSPITLNIFGMPGHSVNWYDEFVLFTGSVENFDAGMFDLVNNSSWTRGWTVSVGNSLVLTAVPEPGTWLMLVFALAFVLLARRQR